MSGGTDLWSGKFRASFKERKQVMMARNDGDELTMTCAQRKRLDGTDVMRR